WCNEDGEGCAPVDDVGLLFRPFQVMIRWLRSRYSYISLGWTSMAGARKGCTMPIQVLLADDHQIVRQGLKATLENEGFRIVGEAGDGLEAVRVAGRVHPEVAILDLVMPGLNGLDAAREIRRASPRTRVILLTMHTDDALVLQALRNGTSASVLK